MVCYSSLRWTARYWIAATPWSAPDVVELRIVRGPTRRGALAAATAERLGYRDVSVLDGGLNRWVTEGFATEWGVNVPSKDFGEKMEVLHHVPELEAKELAERIDKGEKLLILDTRTPE